MTRYLYVLIPALLGFGPAERRDLLACADGLVAETDGLPLLTAGPVLEAVNGLEGKPAEMVANVLVIGAIESGLTRGRRGAAGEIGMFQLMPATAAWAAKYCGVKGDARQPGVNAKLAYCYFDWLMWLAEGDMDAAVAAYNFGPKAIKIVKDYGTLPKVTANYLVKFNRLRGATTCGKY